METPVIEHLVKDGVYEVQMPAPKPTELTADDLFSDVAEEPPKKETTPPSQPPPQKKVLPEPEIFTSHKKQNATKMETVKIEATKQAQKKPISKPALRKIRPLLSDPKYIPPGWLDSADSQVTAADLSDYPEDTPPRSAIDQLLIPFSVLMILIGLLLGLNYVRWIKIPGMEAWRVSIETPTPEPAVTPITTKPKYGFPIIEPEITSPAETPFPEQTVNPQRKRH
jgi:hypothetical protein